MTNIVDYTHGHFLVEYNNDKLFLVMQIDFVNFDITALTAPEIAGQYTFKFIEATALYYNNEGTLQPISIKMPEWAINKEK